MEFVTVYITSKNVEEARKISEELVKERLIGCANIIPSIESIYSWKGRIEKGKEAIIIGKTKRVLIDRIIKKTKDLHSYETPCITFFPIITGNREYLDWINDMTST